jgi:predicted transcriptional regulator YheO
MTRRRELQMLSKLVEALGETFGPFCEVVLHDLTQPESSIVAIHNGHVTGRRVGESLADTGLFDLANRFPDRDVVAGYRTYSSDSRPLRSTTVFFRDQKGFPYAALGINYDLSLLQQLHRYTEQMLDDANIEKPNPIVAGGVNDLLDQLFAEAVQATGKAFSQFDKQDRVAVVRHLERRGAFLIRGAVSSVARLMGVSRVALYGYLEEARSRERSDSRAVPTESGGRPPRRP